MTQYGQYVVLTSDTMVNFGVGQPSNTLLPLELIKRSMVKMHRIEDPALLQYGDIPGYKTFRKDFAEYLSKKYSENVDYKSLFITNGVTGGLSLLCSLFTQKDSIIFLE